ncbi:MAG: NAD(P)-binding domain-containing protein [Pseudomonadota bacterium]
MKIGMIGAGYVGRTLAALAVRQGHEVMISNSRGPETLLSSAVALRCRVGTALQAAAFGDIVLVAIPLKNYRAIPAAQLEGKIVVDANNYYWQRDGRIPVLENHATTTSELLAGHLRGARVVKAFNAIPQDELATAGRPAGTPGRRALPIAGDDAQAKQEVTALVDAFGFDVVDAGALSEGWRFQRAKPAYCARLDAAGMRQALAQADIDIDLPDWFMAPAMMT